MSDPNAPNPPQKTVHIKCKNPKCDSITMVEMPYKPGSRLYSCVKCRWPLAVTVGGKMDVRQL